MVVSQDVSVPLIAVVGATGLQGGSVIRHLAASSSPYRIRGLTRDVSTPQAKALSVSGVELFECDYHSDAGPGVDSCFQGATYVFILTDFWAHLSYEREVKDGKFLVDRALEAKTKLLLISTLPNVTKATKGELTHVYHFDAKAAIAEYSKEVGAPYVEVQSGVYMKNYTSFMRPQPREDGSYVLADTWSHNAKLPMVDTGNDYGAFVRLAIESPEYQNGDGKVISAHAEWLSLDDQVRILSEVTGQKVLYEQISVEKRREILASFGMPAHIIDDMVEMNKFQEFFWPSISVETDLTQLPQPTRNFREYCEHEDWSSVFQ